MIKTLNTKIDKATLTNREAWLLKATVQISEVWKTHGIVVPADVRVTCGFPGGGSPRKRIGECWPRSRSTASVNEVFINPVMDDTMLVLDVLGHELLHAVDDCKSGHRGAFNKNSKAVGYTGGKESKAGAYAQALLTTIAAKLGPYPHAKVYLEPRKQKENTGLHKLECGCGNVAYMTAKKVDEYGLPTCNACGEEMQPLHQREKKKVVTTI